MNKRTLGTHYENLAAEYLEAQGVTILERNYWKQKGEIDLIGMDREGWLLFVEVKYRRSGSSGTPLAAVTVSKQRTISRVALEYLWEHYNSVNVKCRFDVVGIEGETIQWIKNAFAFQGKRGV